MHASRFSAWALAAALLAIGPGLAGCQAGAADARLDRRDLAPLVDAAGQPRGLALASPSHRHALAEAEPAPGLPWYVDRRDMRPAVESGAHVATYERSHTYTVDRQRVVGGRVIDSVHETSRRIRISETHR